MGQRSRGRTRINVQMRALVFSCAALLVASTPSDLSALSLEPVVTTIVSVTQANKSKTTETKTEQQTTRGAKATDASATPAAQSASPGVAAEQAPIVGEPLPELPVIETLAVRTPSVILARPASAVVISHPVVASVAGDSVAPLQPTHQGWKIFGIVWYWWLLGIVTGYFIGRFMRRRLRPGELLETGVTI